MGRELNQKIRERWGLEHTDWEVSTDYRDAIKFVEFLTTGYGVKLELKYDIGRGWVIYGERNGTIAVGHGETLTAAVADFGANVTATRKVDVSV